jgi:uncharacterized membrane protein YidH (DUF202 family)
VTMIFGVVVFIWALVVERHKTGFARIFDSIATSSGVFFILLGLALMFLWAWRHIREERTLSRGAS